MRRLISTLVLCLGLALLGGCDWSYQDWTRFWMGQRGATPAQQERAVDVFDCETGGTWNPRATGRAGERGLSQIHPDFHQQRIRRLGFTWNQMYEPGPNLVVAADLWAEQGFGPWACASRRR